MTQGKGVRQLFGLGECLLGTLESLVWIAQVPQARRRDVSAAHSRVKPVEEDERTVLLRVVQTYSLFQVLSACHKLSRAKQGLPQRPVRHQEERRVLDSLRQGGQLVPKLPHGRELPPDLIKRP